jgi:adenylate kinase family enzyme
MTEQQVLAALEEHEREVAPVLRYYKERMKLVDFEITGGVDQTLPRLLDLLKPHLEVPPLKPLRAQVGA